MQEFEIRASASYNIMADSKSSLTDNQKKELKVLKQKEKLTDNQKEKLQILKHKESNKDISQSAKTYCKDWLKGQIFNRQKTFNNKYTDKGNIMEDEAIDFVAKILNYPMLFKNDESRSNGFIKGTADIVLNDLIIDVKCSWDFETFPLFDDNYNNLSYYWQAQCYMELYNKDRYKLAYCLMDTPEHLIERDARNFSYNYGYEELDIDIYNEFHKNLTYSDIEDKLKIKIYDIKRNDDDIKKIYTRVKECRYYIESLIKSL